MQKYSQTLWVHYSLKHPRRGLSPCSCHCGSTSRMQLERALGLSGNLTSLTAYAPLLRRYIWLPLWVVDIPQAVESPLRGAVHAQQRSIKRNKFRSMRPGPTNMQSLPPVDVVVRYATHLQLPLLYEAWRTHVGGYACVALLWLGPSQAHGQASSTAGIAWCWGSVGPWVS